MRLLFLSWVLLSGLPSLVRADPPPVCSFGEDMPRLLGATRKYARLANEVATALDLYKEGNFAAASRLFREAYLKQPLPGTLYNLAETCAALGERPAALAMAEEVVQSARPGGALRQRALALRDRLRPPQETTRTQPPSGPASPVVPTAAPSIPATPPALPPTVVHLPPAVDRPPLIKRPWFWLTLCGGTVALAGTGIGIGLGVQKPGPSLGWQTQFIPAPTAAAGKGVHR